MRALVIGLEVGRESLADVVSALHLGWTGVEIEQVQARQFDLAALTTLSPDLIVVGTSTPGTALLAQVRRIREHTSVVIAAVCRQYNEADLIEAVEAGADVFMELPLSLPAFVARVRAALRRAGGTQDQGPPAIYGGLVVDPERHEAKLRGKPLQLTPTEFRILLCLAQHGERVTTRESLCTGIWNEDRTLDAATLRKHIQQLRRKLRAVPQAGASIMTIAGVGHKLVTEYEDELGRVSAAGS